MEVLFTDYHCVAGRQSSMLMKIEIKGKNDYKTFPSEITTIQAQLGINTCGNDRK